jgi:hypothetical protein
MNEKSKPKQQSKSTAGDRTQKHPNALKHGVFGMSLLPGEDPESFAGLNLLLIKEWNPAGATEKDAVFSLAKGMWYKARLQKFLWGKVMACQHDPSHPAFDRVGTLQGVVGNLEIDPDCLDQCLKLLPEDLRQRLERDFPKYDFETTSARAEAIKKGIQSVILPELQRVDKPPQVSFLEASTILPPDEFNHLIALEERIEAMIDRAIRRLGHTKTMKQMLESTSNLSSKNS